MVYDAVVVVVVVVGGGGGGGWVGVGGGVFTKGRLDKAALRLGCA